MAPQLMKKKLQTSDTRIKQPKATILTALLASLCLHFFGVAVVHFLESHRELFGQKDPTQSSDQSYEIEYVKLPPHETKQVVESERASNDHTPMESKYLGEKNQTVDLQTKAQLGSRFQKLQQAAAMHKLAPKTDFSPLAHLQNREGAENLNQGATTNDHLKDIAQGAQTMLSTYEYAYFSFYRRVKRQLEQHWEPGLKKRIIRMSRRGRSVASDQEHLTKLFVTLDNVGRIVRVQVAETSGLIDLDEAAIDSFNKAGPFPNPPKGMLNAEGSIQIEWEFILRT